MANVFDVTAAIAGTATLTMVGKNPYRMYLDANDNVTFNVEPGPGAQHILGLLYHSKNIPAARIATAASSDTVAYTCNGEAYELNEDGVEMANHVVAEYETYRQWCLFLVACAQGGGVSEDNLENFFAMNSAKAGGLAKLQKLLVHLASEMPMLVTNEAVREKFRDNSFFQYRISKSQAGDLCSRAISICPINGIFSDAEIATVETAKSGSWDLTLAHNIPDHTLFKARAVLDAMDVLPNTWHMGKNAYDKGSPLQYNSLVKLVKKASVIQQGYDLEAVETMDELHGIVNNLAWLSTA